MPTKALCEDYALDECEDPFDEDFDDDGSEEGMSTPVLSLGDFLNLGVANSSDLHGDSGSCASDWSDVDVFDVRSCSESTSDCARTNTEDDTQRFRGVSRPIGAQPYARRSTPTAPQAAKPDARDMVHQKLRKLLRDRYSMCVSAGSSVSELKQLLAVKTRQDARRERLNQYRTSSVLRSRAYCEERDFKGRCVT
jgi:hypothetical protein